MRTTVDLDKTLLDRAKRLALKEGGSLGTILNNALRAYLGVRKSSEKDPTFELIVRGQPGARFPSPAEVEALEDDELVASLGVAKAGRRASP